MPSLIVAQLKVVEELVQPAGSALNPDVIVRSVAGLLSSVAKVTVTGVLVPVSTASEELGLGVPAIVSLVSARYGMASEPVFVWFALFL